MCFKKNVNESGSEMRQTEKNGTEILQFRQASRSLSKQFRGHCTML